MNDQRLEGDLGQFPQPRVLAIDQARRATVDGGADQAEQQGHRGLGAEHDDDRAERHAVRPRQLRAPIGERQDGAERGGRHHGQAATEQRGGHHPVPSGAGSARLPEADGAQRAAGGHRRQDTPAVVGQRCGRGQPAHGDEQHAGRAAGQHRSGERDVADVAGSARGDRHGEDGAGELHRPGLRQRGEREAGVELRNIGLEAAQEGDPAGQTQQHPGAQQAWQADALARGGGKRHHAEREPAAEQTCQAGQREKRHPVTGHAAEQVIHRPGARPIRQWVSHAGVNKTLPAPCYPPHPPRAGGLRRATGADFTPW